MDQRADPRPLLLAMLAAAAFVWLAPSAMAADADYCVTCKDPDQTYRCRVTGVGSRPHDALKLYCVIRTAKDGHHASCKASVATAACQGVVKVYDYLGPSLPDAVTADPRVRELQQRVEQDRRAFAEPEGDEPKTLFELGERAMSASRKGLRNAGSAIGITSSADEPPPADSSGNAQPAAPTAALPSASRPSEAPPTASLAKPESVGTVARVKQATRDVGSAVSGFARKSYNCVLSLFRNCREEAEN